MEIHTSVVQVAVDAGTNLDTLSDVYDISNCIITILQIQL